MEFEAWIALSVSLLLFFVGIVLTILPIFPGQILVFLGVALFQIWRPEEGPGVTFLLIGLAVTLVSLVLDLALSVRGARKHGAGWRGSIGAIIGGLVGIFIPPPLFWIFFGPVVGAIAGELIGGRKPGEAGRVGWGTFTGTLLAMAIKLAVCIFLIGGFAVLVIRETA